MKAIYGKDIEIGRSLLDYMSVAKDREDAKRNLDRALAGEHVTEESYSGEEERSRRFFVVSHSPIIAKDGAIIGVAILARDVTERKRMEDDIKRYSEHLEEMVGQRTKQLAESETRFRELAALLPQIVFEIDAHGNLIFMNRSGVVSLGYSEKDVLGGLNVRQVFIEHDRGRIRENMRKLLAGEQLGTNEYTILRKDGSTFPVLIHSTRVIRDGVTVGLRGIAMDITERKQLENELRTVKDRLENLVASNPAVIYSGKPLPDLSDWVLTYVSDRVVSVLGYSPEDFMSGVEFWRMHVHPDDLRANPAIVQELWSKGQLSYEYRFQHKDGSNRWIREEAIVARDAKGRPIEVNGYWVDVTVLKQAEEAIAASERRYRELFMSSPVSLWEEDFSDVKRYFDQLRKRGIDNIERYLTEHPEEVTKCAAMVKVLDVNNATMEIYGTSSVEELLSQMRRVLSQESVGNFREELIALAKGKTRFVGEFDNQNLKVGMKHVSVILSVLPGYEESLGKVLVSVVDLTDRKRMEEELRASRERLDYIIASNPSVIYVAKPLPDFSDYYMTFVSKSVIAATGFEEEFIGERGASFWASRVHPDDLASYRKGTSEFWTKGRQVWEYRFLHMNGTYRWILEEANLIRDSAGKVLDVVGCWTDITERKRVEEELRASRERLEHVVSSNPAVIYIAKPLSDFSDYYAIYESKSTVSITGFESEVFIGEKGNAFWATRLHPDDLAPYKAGMDEFWRDGHRVWEYRFLHKDGSYRWLREEANVIRDSKGIVSEIIGYWIDTTQLKRMEEELQASKRQLEYVIASNPAAIYSAKPLPDLSDWHLTFVSDRVTGIVGFEPWEFVDKPGLWNSRIHPDDVSSFYARTPSFFKSGHGSFDYRFLCKNGSYRWVREEVTLIRDADGKPVDVNGCWTDITELKEMEQRLKEAEHLAGIGEAAAMVGHDLRNPLQGIAGAVHVLGNVSLSAKERDEMLQLIQNCVEYSDGIVKDLLDYARPLELARVETTPKEIATRAIQMVQIPGRIKVQDLSQERPKISVDMDRMKRAFVNLVENAIDAMPGGGTLTVTSNESSGGLEISISDTGAGMSKDVMGNLWKPLQTTKAKGMGMGLSIAKRIVDAHGGEISVESKTGEGTTFTIRLPIKPIRCDRVKLEGSSSCSI
jgi:PAS domain S-box-containing protein